MAGERHHDGRSETATEKLDRNWNDLLQELRVAQTGVQLLTGLLLTLPFQRSGRIRVRTRPGRAGDARTGGDRCRLVDLRRGIR